MEDLNLKLKQLDECVQHKMYLLKAGQKLIIQLFQKGEEEFALELLKNIMNHDDSKANKIEFEGMADDPDIDYSYLTKKKFDAIKHHWRNNPHHPEYWARWEEEPESIIPEKPHEISKEFGENPIYIAEMCCDWVSRSMQYQTDIVHFWEKEAPKRWQFDRKTKSLIEMYLYMLVDKKRPV